MEALGYILSLVMGLLLGLLGGGGSILTLPILVYLFQMPAVHATGHSLFVVGLTALSGNLMTFRQKRTNWQVGILFAIPSLIGVHLSRSVILPSLPALIFSSSLFSLTKESLIMGSFALVMILASFSMIRRRNIRPEKNQKPLHRLIFIGSLGLLVGLVAGFVGAGGGFLITPALVLFGGLSMHAAVATSLMIIALQSLLGFAGDVVRGVTFDWALLLRVSALAIVGIVAGSHLGIQIKEENLKKSFGWFVLVMGILILSEQIYRLVLKPGGSL